MTAPQPPGTPAQTPPFLYGTAWKQERTAELTLAALKAGFRGIDTANQRKHYFEAGVGEALARAYGEGLTTREEVFLQTKFTYLDGQDHRLPYDPDARLSLQVAQSMAKSLEHLRTDRVDSFVLHGPSSGYNWTEDDCEAWEAMVKERDAGRARWLGVSNVALRHLEQLVQNHGDVPAFVQNRCYARTGWDSAVRAFCREHHIVYQGFSLLTANTEIVGHPYIQGLAKREGSGAAPVIFAFARAVGMLPLTGTTDAGHMRQDLAALGLRLSSEEVRTIETLAA